MHCINSLFFAKGSSTHLLTGIPWWMNSFYDFPSGSSNFFHSLANSFFLGTWVDLKAARKEIFGSQLKIIWLLDSYEIKGKGKFNFFRAEFLIAISLTEGNKVEATFCSAWNSKIILHQIRVYMIFRYFMKWFNKFWIIKDICHIISLFNSLNLKPVLGHSIYHSQKPKCNFSNQLQ